MKRISLLVFLALIPLASAHETGIEVKDQSLDVIFIASGIIALFTAASLLIKKKSNPQKAALFLGIAVPTILATVYVAGSTISLNLASESGGPVHWHADFEVWNCGQKLDLQDPEGLLNRVGSPLFHEHGDDRIHIEGVVTDLEDVSFHKFIESVGGQLNPGLLILPTNSGLVEMRDGQPCNSGPGKVQAFLFKVTNPSAPKEEFRFAQEKLEEIGEYAPSHYSTVPPGDCIILEFSLDTPRTDHICSTYNNLIEEGAHGG